jgi:hypothetical protein
MAAFILVSPPTWPWWSAAGGFITANATTILVGAGVITAGGVAVHQMSKAESAAQARDKAGTKTVACATCRDNPCAHLAAGRPGAKYRGGAAGGLKGVVGDDISPHHTPADSASPLPWPVGPAVQMDKADHEDTLSYGSSKAALEYQATQRQLINSGQFLKAQAMDIADLAQFSPKYDDAILQMEAYTICLKKNGLIQ